MGTMYILEDALSMYGAFDWTLRIAYATIKVKDKAKIVESIQSSTTYTCFGTS